ncbi:pseudouridylate synthase PUS7L isoform X1 [Periophthalmus magnuspinnatus]|uniref:pseudouridylate synthase PUS7L isoform X1 n=1 Tax=Periophthalmus magnuspinnatus TaxID=409849 RepID=UPI00145B96FD|nr:pseudouridylate synthase PUS7L isoform X1 [Periophthalmus magnuspinnatus]
MMASVYLMSKHEGFTGSIKNFTRDFVVTEIDISGNQVSKSTISEDVPRSFVEKTRESVKEPDVSPIIQKTEQDCNSPSPEILDLAVILSQGISDKLEQFVSSLKNGFSSDQELSLGSFTDKHQRANVHRTVKLRFPFLMTTTNQCEIKVQESQDYKELKQLVSEEEADAFFRFTDAKVSGSSYTFLPDDSKEHRTAVHRFLSRRFGKLVETKSFTDQGKTSISVRLRERGKPKKRTAEDCRQEDIYTAFTLCKENLETLEAISYMATELGVLPSDFTYAGIKDKRAITYQSMVVKKVSPERLKEKAAEFERKGIQLFAVRSVSEPLKLGRLRGNHFDIVVRGIKPHIYDGPVPLAYTEDLVKAAVEMVKNTGFVNYYGPQRFGITQRVQSDQIGLALLKEDMVSAVHLFFTPDKGDEPQNQAKRHFLETGNAKEALLLMPESKARERLMLRAMNRYGTGPDGCGQAWLSLPHSTRIFYLHSYCSRVWNEAVAHRLSILGHSVKQGDLVQEVTGTMDDSADTSSNQIHVVTEEEERGRVYTLGQVLLPMPGNTVKYPENAMGAWYRERLSKDGLESCRFRVNSLKLNVPGCYRPLLAFPRNLDYRLQREQEDGVGNCTEAVDEGGNDKTEDQVKLNLTLNFDLFPSCYATVYLREVMKFMVN